MRRAIGRLGLLAIVLILVGTAAAKTMWLLSTAGRTAEAYRVAYWLPAAFEIALAGSILWPRMRGVALSLTFWGFLGAAAVSAALIVGRHEPGTCHCLGAPATTQSIALALQGTLVFLAGATLRARSRLRS